MEEEDEQEEEIVGSRGSKFEVQPHTCTHTRICRLNGRTLLYLRVPRVLRRS